MSPIPFFDARTLAEELGAELRAAADRVLRSGRYLLGPELEAFETELAQYVGTSHAVGVANGTDAIELALRALDLGPGDEVIAPAHTAVPTICAIERAGAAPVLADIQPASYGLCPRAVEAAVSPSTKAIVVVHLYGQPADLEGLQQVAARHGLALVEDCAQALGARLGERRVGTFGTLSACSFYPTKNLGALGDAGAVLTGDAALARRVRRLRQYGQEPRNWAIETGLNSRLDELQAALLRVKLAKLDDHQRRRRALADRYAARLASAPGLTLPAAPAHGEHAWHLYVVRHARRDALAAALEMQNIGTMIHYPYAIHRQPAYARLAPADRSLAAAEQAAPEVLSLPLFVGLSPQSVDTVAAAVTEFLTV